MLAITFLCIMTAGLTYYQVFTQGLFSSLIMAVLSIVSAMVALNYYEPLAALLTDLGMASFGPKTISLLGVFVLTLLLLRELADRFIRGNMKFPQGIDRVGSTVFAIISSLTISGMVALGFQSLPLSATIMGFERCPKLDTPSEDKRLYPMGDAFVLSTFAKASNYCFAGTNSFQQVHPNMLRELYLNRVVAKDHKGSRQEAGSNAISIDKNKVRFINHEISYDKSQKKLEPGNGEVFLAVQLKIKSGTGKRGDRGAADVDKAIRFALCHVRMVGFNPDDKSSPGISRYPIGKLSNNDRTVTNGKLDSGNYFKKNATVDLLFKWPEKIKETPPLFVEFKRSARADMPSIKELMAKKSG